MALKGKALEDWKKKNFNMNVKVTEAQLDKLRKEGTPTKAIAKYKNDPKMREALNRFYGKDRINKAIGSGTGSTKPPGGPGSTMTSKPPKGSGPGYTRQNPRSGGPGAKTGKDGRTSANTKTITMGSRTGGKITLNKAANDRRKAEFQNRTAKAIAVGSAIVPVGRGAMMATTAAKKMAPKATSIAKSTATKVTSKVKSVTSKTSKTPTTPAPKVTPKPAAKKTTTPKKGSQ
jgi:hypothetical protein